MTVKQFKQSTNLILTHTNIPPPPHPTPPPSLSSLFDILQVNTLTTVAEKTVPNLPWYTKKYQEAEDACYRRKEEHWR